SPARATPHALRAAERAAALHAHREALGHYELALAGSLEPSPELLAALGDQHAAPGEPAAGVVRSRAGGGPDDARGAGARRAEPGRRWSARGRRCSARPRGIPTGRWRSATTATPPSARWPTTGARWPPRWTTSPPASAAPGGAA